MSARPAASSRIAIDLRMVGAIPHGIARYALALWNGLPARPDRTYLALHRPEAVGVTSRRPGDELWVTRAPFLSPLEQIELPATLRRAGADLLHATSFSVPAAWRGPLVLSLHDLTHLGAPELRTPARRAYYQLIVGPAARRARQVLTVSQFARQEIAAGLGLAVERIAVVPNATDLPEEPVRALTAGTIPLLLALGHAKPYKNLALLSAMMNRLEAPARLLLVGPGLEALAGPRVEIVASVSEAQLLALYRSAAVFLCPSRSEGFGLPPLEAARLGLPLVLARAGALPEIWQGAGEILPAADPDAWARAVEGLLRDEAARVGLAARCQARAAQFSSWDALLRAADAAYG